MTLSTGNTKGQDTDVQAIGRDVYGNPSDVITVIIEHKCCWHWHNGLMTAMENQLVERCLKDNKCRHGFYLVTWFESTKLDPSDNRRPPAMSRADAAETFAKQAAHLSTTGLVIRSVVLDESL